METIQHNCYISLPWLLFWYLGQYFHFISNLFVLYLCALRLICPIILFSYTTSSVNGIAVYFHSTKDHGVSSTLLYFPHWGLESISQKGFLNSGLSQFHSFNQYLYILFFGLLQWFPNSTPYNCSFHYCFILYAAVSYVAKTQIIMAFLCVRPLTDLCCLGIKSQLHTWLTRH